RNFGTVRRLRQPGRSYVQRNVRMSGEFYQKRCNIVINPRQTRVQPQITLLLSSIFAGTPPLHRAVSVVLGFLVQDHWTRIGVGKVSRIRRVSDMERGQRPYCLPARAPSLVRISHQPRRNVTSEVMLTNASEPSANTRVVYCKGLAARGRTTVSSSLMDPTFGYARCTEWKESSSLILMKQSVFVDESELIARLIYAYLEPPLLPVLFLFVWLLKGTMLKNYLALDKHVLSERKLAEFYPKSILLHFGGIVLTSILLVFNQINRNYLNVLVDYKFLILVVQLLSISMQVSWILRIATKSLETIYDNLALVEDPSYADIRRTIKTHEFTTDVLESFVEGYGPLILITTPLCLMEITAICRKVQQAIGCLCTEGRKRKNRSECKHNDIRQNNAILLYIELLIIRIKDSIFLIDRVSRINKHPPNTIDGKQVVLPLACWLSSSCLQASWSRDQSQLRDQTKLRCQTHLRDRTKLRDQTQLRFQTQLRGQTQLRDQSRFRDQTQLRVQRQLRDQSQHRDQTQLRVQRQL
ncbi:unnamed protein product, partial [Nesidiocoris tenuis]